MNDKSEFFKPYPKYEDVFYDDIENHKKYFLPICSINLKFMFPERDEWLHFISVKEIYEGCVGENTFDFHTAYTKEDMFGFDIIDGKYKFDASWDYFYINHKDNSSYFNELGNAYEENSVSYKVGKEYFEKYGKIFPRTLNWENISLETLEALERDDKEKYPDYKYEYPEFFGLLDDIKHQSTSAKEMMEEYNISIEEMNTFEDTNLLEVPKNNSQNVFEYIGNLTGYNFQKNGADALYLFQNQELKKAVICLEYT